MLFDKQVIWLCVQYLWRMLLAFVGISTPEVSLSHLCKFSMDGRLNALRVWLLGDGVSRCLRVLYLTYHPPATF